MGNWFVACPIDGSGWYEAWSAHMPPEVRIFAPVDLHLTLAFLGRHRQDRESAVCETMAQHRFKPFYISLGKLLALPKPQRLSAISFSLDQGREAAAHMISSLRPALYDAAAVQGDQRPPLPHITIGRPRHRKNAAERQQILSWIAKAPIPEINIKIDRMALYGWSQDRRTQQFQIIQSYGI